MLGRRAPDRRAARRAPTSRCSSAATTGRSRASAPGATGWVTGVADCAPAECVELYDACRAADLERARAVYARLLPLARLDMTPKLVQYFKGAQDALGFAGGPVRAAAAARSTTHDRAVLDAAVAALRAPVAA